MCTLKNTLTLQTDAVVTQSACMILSKCRFRGPECKASERVFAWVWLCVWAGLRGERGGDWGGIEVRFLCQAERQANLRRIPVIWKHVYPFNMGTRNKGPVQPPRPAFISGSVTEQCYQRACFNHSSFFTTLCSTQQLLGTFCSALSPELKLQTSQGAY